MSSTADLFDFDMKEAVEERIAIMADSDIHDDELAYTYTEKFRAECEARWCLDSMDLIDRRKYLSLVEVKRGIPGRKTLEAGLMDEFYRRKKAA